MKKFFAMMVFAGVLVAAIGCDEKKPSTTASKDTGAKKEESKKEETKKGM